VIEEIFRRMQECNLCFPDIPLHLKRTWRGNGSVGDIREARVLILGESPSPHRDFEGTFGMKSQPAFKVFIEELTKIPEFKKWWALNVNNCNCPSLSLSAELDPPRKVCRYFPSLFSSLIQEGEVRYVIAMGRKVVRAILGEDLPLNCKPVVMPVAERDVLIFPSHHPMHFVRSHRIEEAREEARKIIENLRGVRNTLLAWGLQ